MKLVALTAIVLAVLLAAFAFGRVTVTQPASAAPTDAQLNALRAIHRDLLAIQKQLGSPGTPNSIFSELEQICRHADRNAGQSPSGC